MFNNSWTVKANENDT